MAHQAALGEGAGVRLSRRLTGLLLAFLIAGAAACAPATVQKREAQTLDSIYIVVDSAMKAAATFYKEGRVYDPQAGAWVVVSPDDVLLTDQQWADIGVVHEKYRRAGKVAALVIKNLGPTAGGQAALLADVRLAADEVVALINLFTKKNGE